MKNGDDDIDDQLLIYEEMLKEEHEEKMKQNKKKDEKEKFVFEKTLQKRKDPPLDASFQEEMNLFLPKKTLKSNNLVKIHTKTNEKKCFNRNGNGELEFEEEEGGEGEDVEDIVYEEEEDVDEEEEKEENEEKEEEKSVLGDDSTIIEEILDDFGQQKKVKTPTPTPTIPKRNTSQQPTKNEITNQSKFEKLIKEDYYYFSRSHRCNIDSNDLKKKCVESYQENGLKFQVSHIDYKSNISKRSGGDGKDYYTIFGVTGDSKSIMVESYGFQHYYHVALPEITRSNKKYYNITDNYSRSKDPLKLKLDIFKSDLNKTLSEIVEKGETERQKEGVSQNDSTNSQDIIIAIEHSELKDILDAKTYKPIPLLKLIFKYNGSFQKNFQEKLRSTYSCKIYEGDIKPVGRYSADMDIYGGAWIQILPKAFENLDSIENVNEKSRSTLNFRVNHTNLFKDVNEKKMGPLVTLIYDIECISGSGHFPKAVNDEDPIVMISNHIIYPDYSRARIIFMQKNCDDINNRKKKVKRKTKKIVDSKEIEVEAEVEVDVEKVILRHYEDEKSLLKDWLSFFKMVDPDITSGYNNANFDLPYIHDRCHLLGLSKEFSSLGRLGNNAKKREISTGSKQIGKKESTQVKLIGVIELDMLPHIQKRKNFSSYTLEYVSNYFLKDNKLKVHHSYISILYNGTDAQRATLAEYCIKDSELVADLILKLCAITEVFGMAKVTKINVQDAISSGQQVRYKGQLLDLIKRKNLGFVCPTNFSKNAITYPGGKVFEPTTGFYVDAPIATLDFQSLYPSIMIEHNLCYTTLIDLAYINKHGLVENVDYTKTPSNQYFLTLKHRQGILPLLLKNLLGERARVRGEQKLIADKSSIEWSVLDGEQLAYKVSANSIYGATGFSCGFLPCLEIASSVTAFARHHIVQAKNFVEESNPTYKVIYGDTDSIMVKIPGATVGEALQIMDNLSRFVTKKLNNKGHPDGKEVLNLQAEKVYYPYLLMGKKKYVGTKWTSDVFKKTGLPEEECNARGVESVRRDNTQFTRDLLNIAFKALFKDKVPVHQLGEILKPHITNLLDGKVDISKLIITNSISKPINSYDGKVAHIEVAKKLRSRVPENPPRMGDRIRYTLIKTGNSKTKASECAECPDYIIENNLQIDYEKLYKTKVLPPIERVLYVIYNHLAMQKDNTTTRRINGLLKKMEDSLHGLSESELKVKTKKMEKKTKIIMEEIVKDSKVQVDKILNVFNVKKGIQISDIALSKKDGLLKFGFTLTKCLICNKSHNNKDSKLCLDCSKNDKERIKENFLVQFKSVESEVESMKKTCHDCQKLFQIKQECGNYDCDKGIYYKRIIKGKEYKALLIRKNELEF